MGTDLCPCLNAQGQWRRGPFSPRAVSWKVTGLPLSAQEQQMGFCLFPRTQGKSFGHSLWRESQASGIGTGRDERPVLQKLPLGSGGSQWLVFF